MKIATREDVEATIDQVFDAVTDFNLLERSMLRRGAEIMRTDTLPTAGPGMTWMAKLPYRGREHIADIEVKTLDRPEHLVVFSKVSGIEATIEIELLALSRQRTRMNIGIDMRPKTIPSRLVIQSLKLARSRVLRRFRSRVADFAKTIEDRHRA